MKPDTDELDHEPHIERMIDRADHLRTERKDREWEESNATSQEPEHRECGTTHYAGCDCHERGWENKWKSAIEIAARASLERDEYKTVAGELIAAIRVNVLRGTFAAATIEQIDEWLNQWAVKMK